MKQDEYLRRREIRLKENEKAQRIMSAMRKREKSELELMAINKLLPEFLSLRQIAILSGYTEFVFESVIERTALKIEERKIEDSNCHDGFYIEKGCTKQAYKNHLQSIEQWPVDGLLGNWWIDEQSNATTQTDNKPNLTTIKTNVFCNPPKKKDSWFDAIEETALTLFNELGKLPNEAQAWGRLSANPPHGYEIKPGADKGEDCLTMPGNTSLPKSGFSKRWKRYTAKKRQ